MFRRLAGRNVVLMVVVVLAGQLVAGLLVMALVVGPQVERVANVTADTISALSEAMASTPPGERNAMLARINAGGELAIRTAAEAPGSGRRFPTFIERRFTRALADRLTSQSHLVWRTDERNRLWIRLALGGNDYWVSTAPPQARGAMTSLLISFASAFIVAVAGGIILQRRLDAPLRKLARAVDDFEPESANERPLDTSGPEEVAAVAGAFNRMTARLREQEAERALMLGGVSHDLRTPLTRLRLCLEMMRADDTELERTALRQVDRIETMLAQFLDFARGFENEPVERRELGPLLERIAVDAGAGDEVDIDAPAGLAARIRPDALSRAVGNLLANALRHGAAPIRMEAREAGGRLRIAVVDSGQGISPLDAAALTRPFARGNSARSGDGTGLGLAIAERVAAAHGGCLRFERTPGSFAAMIDIPSGGMSGDERPESEPEFR